jgi:hypothetical protein
MKTGSNADISASSRRLELPQRKYVYVAGPYTEPDPVLNTRNAILAAEALIAEGYIPYVPHLSLLWNMLAPHDVEHWYEFDLKWLERCDRLPRLPGESSGADREVRRALKLGMPVDFGLEALCAAYRTERTYVEATDG